ncbi:MAG: hypothetical protein RIM99_17620 [Cyclobacteriaceae bacterium]
MRTISRIMPALFMLALGIGAIAQEKIEYPDTLRITAEEIEIVVALESVRKRPKLDDDLWNSILGAMESSINSSANDAGIKATYQNIMVGEEKKARIDITPLDKESDIFLIGSEGLNHMTAERIEFLVIQEEVSLSFSINEMDQLESMKAVSVEGIWNELESNAEKIENKRALYSGEGNINFGVLRLSKINQTNPRDFVELSAGVGVGFYRDQFMPSISYDVSFGFSDRYGKPSKKFGLLYTQHYAVSRETEGSTKLELNGFLSAYATLITKTDQQFGLGFGYLINQNGGFYHGETFILSVYNRKSSRTSLTPELIFTDGFNQVFPALRFGLTF